jgi:hypothetical protein
LNPKPHQYTRREVNRALLVSAFALASGLPVAFSASRRHLFDFAIAGQHYYALDAERRNIASGGDLVLRRELDNPHDSNAVAVHMPSGAKLGFIPRLANEPVAQLLDHGHELSARVLSVLPMGWFAIPDDLVYTMVVSGDPIVRLMLEA